MSTPSPDAILRKVWEGRIPLEIVLSPSESRTYDKTDPYIISYPRVCYLPHLMPKLLAFFSSSLIQPDAQQHQGWFSFEGVPLRWHYPLGLLYDLYAGADPVTSRSSVHGQTLHLSEQAPEDEPGSRNRVPWRLTVHFTDWPEQDLVPLDADGEVMHDAYVNTVKEADFVRNGSGKAIMSLSKADSQGLWQAVEDHDFASYKRISHTLHTYLALPLRNIPLRVFLPSPSDSDSPTLKVLQSPFPPYIRDTSTSRGSAQQPQVQTLGTALHSLLPTLFPSRRFPVHAKPVLHGAVVPMTAPLEDVLWSAIYADGWLSVVVKMM